MEMLSYFNPPGYSSMGVVNTEAWRGPRCRRPTATARRVAGAPYAGLLEPGPLLSPDLLAEATSPQSEGYRPILHEDVTFGLGFKPTVPRRPFGPNQGASATSGPEEQWGLPTPRGRGVRLRDESRHPPLAEHAQPVAHRRAYVSL